MFKHSSAINSRFTICYNNKIILPFRTFCAQRDISLNLGILYVILTIRAAMIDLC